MKGFKRVFNENSNKKYLYIKEVTKKKNCETWDVVNADLKLR